MGPSMDDGTAVDISWDRSSAPDFSHYTIWVSDYPLDDLSEVSAACEISGACGLITIDQRQIGNSPRLEVTVGSALYGQPTLLSREYPLKYRFT